MGIDWQFLRFPCRFLRGGAVARPGGGVRQAVCTARSGLSIVHRTSRRDAPNPAGQAGSERVHRTLQPLDGEAYDVTCSVSALFHFGEGIGPALQWPQAEGRGQSRPFCAPPTLAIRYSD